MTVDSLLKKIPDYAIDVKSNLTDVLIKPSKLLDLQRRYSIALSVAYLLGNEILLNHVKASAKIFLEGRHVNRYCRLAVITTTIYNTYYTFSGALLDKEFHSIDPEISIQSITNRSDVDSVNFEMCSLAVSIINNCKFCINAHTKKLLDHNISRQSICEIAKIVAVLKSVATVLNIEHLRNCDFIPDDSAIDS